LILALALACVLTSAKAQVVHVWDDSAEWWDQHLQSNPDYPNYNGNELSLDLFGSYLGPEKQVSDLFHHDVRHGYGGGGGGLNYFLTEEFGFGAEFNVSPKPEGLRNEDYLLGNLYARLPIGATGLSPYIIGSAGRGMSPTWEWIYGAGLGLEYRFNALTGIFSDARFLWSHESTSLDSLTIRVGVRLVF